MDSEFAREELAPRNDTVNESQSGQKFSDLLIGRKRKRRDRKACRAA
jgi:hypothetical protein